MRLTLRTLLAYLDNTLDPQDAEALRDKLGESGFATQLVQRIRGSLANGTLPAPSPEAVGPVEEANVISEYLDSTLPTEQVAEIERACLESDPHLAEAAACHQILTMILGKPAEVSPELRERVYELPDRNVEDIAAHGSFSGVSIPTDVPQLKPLADDVPTVDVTAERSGEPVQPVGASDSGVSDAPTRLREAEQSEASQEGDGPALAGSRPQSIGEMSQGYGGSVRPSRITPWVVSLALAGVLLFALTRIFQPLLNPRTVSLDVDESSAGEIVIPAAEAPVMVDVDSDSAAGQEDAEPLPAPDASAMPEETPSEPQADVPAADGDADQPPQRPSTAVAREDPAADGSAEERSEKPAVAASEEMPATSEAASPGAAPGEAPGAAPVIAPAPPDADPPATAKADPPDPPPASEVAAPAKQEIAQIVSDASLIAALIGEQWVRLENEMMVGPDVTIACAPMYRGEMKVENASITMVGPARVRWRADDASVPTLHVESGRILVSATSAGASLGVQLGDVEIKMDFADAGSVAAASIKHFRAPGFDPLKPENRVAVIGVLSVQGGLEMAIGGNDVELETHQQWVKHGSADASVSVVEAGSLPGWIDAPDPTKTTLESSARSGLIELMASDQPLEIALREAILFRRTEVSALAAQTLAILGEGDIYFGGDGILSTPKQRAYWPDHFTTLLATVDRSAESAEELLASIERMDSANAKPLFRLLTGYSQKQLVEGGDEQLVELLDSSSMSVRVLAIENLHRVTGTTLYYRAEQEHESRRAAVIKKWVARLRKGDIRWQE